VLRAVTAILALACPLHAVADAIIRTQAMFATTIAEYLVEEDGVTLDLEIGAADLEAFKNLMPDEIYEKLGNDPMPLIERLRIFYEDNLPIVPDTGEPLLGRILAMGPEERIKRDPVTGEPLAAGDEEPEMVVRVRIRYPWKSRPEVLTFGMHAPGRQPSLGFLVYHEGIAVNDFRYLSARQVLRLDWDDPWYSSFGARALRRSNFAPMSGFIYVEPYEVRKEIIIRPKDLQNWVDLGVEGLETIPVTMQDELKRKAAEFLRQRHTVLIDGERIEPELARINFLERTLRTSRVIDPPVDLDINAAILGVIFVYPTVEPLPQRVTMDWDLFNDRVRRVSAASVDQAGPLPVYLEPDYNVLEWQNFLKFPELPTLVAILPPPTRFESAMRYGRWFLVALLGGAIAWGFARVRREPGMFALPAVAIVICLLLTAGGFWLGRAAELSDDKATEVVAGLLHNVYRAFDFRGEEQIYDVLEQSVEGDLLARIYLETRRGLELANQGGARAKVKAIEVIDLGAEAGPDGGFVASTTWNVAGSVGHWGHIHERRNQYRAKLTVRPVDGAWKLSDLEILEEQRL
jgi:hypothetical protein